MNPSAPPDSPCRAWSISAPNTAWWQPVVLGALAGGMGWGIRGQYGHETGAMIAGTLVGLVLVLVFAGQSTAAPALRAAAWCAVAMGFGGSMTYGQTVGLTHDPALVGHAAALRWGLLGLAIKGGLWIGFGGAFLGMGLGGTRYRTVEMVGVMAGLLVLSWLGIQLLNRPFQPADHRLPALYFSADWRWQPGATLKPRPEVWGGFLAAFAGLVAYTGWIRRDGLARNLALWGALGGALGFPLGQCLQAFHAWNRAAFAVAPWAAIDARINWWNWMETTFGAIMGASLGLGLWLNRHRIRLEEAALPKPLPRMVEGLILGVHLALVAGEEFTDHAFFQSVYDFGLLLGCLPIILLAAGRLTPLLLLLPGIAMPIAGKTVRELVMEQQTLPTLPGVLLYGVLPVGLLLTTAVWLQRRVERGVPAGPLLAVALSVTTLVYGSLNFAFFHYPWPWKEWTVRTPNALVFTACAAGLLVTAVRRLPPPNSQLAARSPAP